MRCKETALDKGLHRARAPQSALRGAHDVRRRAAPRRAAAHHRRRDVPPGDPHPRGRELGKLDGRARELVEAKLRVEADCLVPAERQLAETERDLADLEVADAEATWMLGALRDFETVWRLMTPENRGRLLRALVAAVRVNDATCEVEIDLVNFSADTRTEEAAA